MNTPDPNRGREAWAHGWYYTKPIGNHQYTEPSDELMQDAGVKS